MYHIVNYMIEGMYLVDLCLLTAFRYTSIGSTHDTIPNPALKTGAGFDPAYKLIDGTKERAGRLSG